jgi:plastocyanin
VGSIHGVVKLEGAAPAMAELPLPGDCMAGRSEPARDESVVAADGKLANVLVYISQGQEAWIPPPAPTSEVTIDQHGCTYAPHVVGLRIGQPLAITNSDPLTHNIHGVPESNEIFNEPMPAQSPKITRTFDQAEIFQMKCDIHPWMNARIGIFEHGWFAVTGAKGEYDLAGVPPGSYTVTAWHEKLPAQTAQVTVAAKTAATADFTFKP